MTPNVGNDGGSEKCEEWVPGTAGDETSTVEISISFRLTNFDTTNFQSIHNENLNLADRDTFSKSDPICVVSRKPPGVKNWVPFLRTEMIENDLDPDFATKITMDYKFEQMQALRFEAYDVDSASDKLEKQDSLGWVDVSLGQIVSAGEEGLTMDLSGVPSSGDNRPASTIILTAEELASEKDEVVLKLGGNSIGNEL